MTKGFDPYATRRRRTGRQQDDDDGRAREGVDDHARVLRALAHRVLLGGEALGERALLVKAGAGLALALGELLVSSGWAWISRASSSADAAAWLRPLASSSSTFASSSSPFSARITSLTSSSSSLARLLRRSCSSRRAWSMEPAASRISSASSSDLRCV